MNLRALGYLCFLIAQLSNAAENGLDNEFVRVTRDHALCANAASPTCGVRVLVALGNLHFKLGNGTRSLARGDIAVLERGERHGPPKGGAFFEVQIKPNHPPAKRPAEVIAAEKNFALYDSEDFFIFEERLNPGDTRARHSHSQRVVIQLNRTLLRQWRDGEEAIDVETKPDHPLFNPPVIHTVKNLGQRPLRGIIIEFKPPATGTQ